MDELFTAVRRALRGQMGTYVQFGVVLFLLSVLMLATLSMSGCGDCNQSAFRAFGSGHAGRYTVRSYIQGRFGMQRQDDGLVAPGSLGLRRFKAEAPPPGVQFVWTPPRGAGNFVFPPGHEPLPGGPPFVWDSLPSGDLAVEFRYPSLPPGAGETVRTDTFAAQSPAGDEGYVSFDTLISPGGGARTAAPPAPARAAGPAQELPVWRVERWLDPAVITLTTPLCQDLMDWLQSDSVYLATRLPVSATQAITQAYPLPIHLTAPPSNTLRLLSHSPTTDILSASLELRQAGTDFAETYLPAAPGEHWVALGVSGDEPAVCPPGLDLPPRGWSLSAAYLLSLGHVAGDCADCLLPTYYCYEGQELPALDALRSAALLAGAAPTGIQAEGTTCIGPELTHLHAPSSWLLGGVGAARVMPSQVISLYHYVYVPDPLGSLEVNVSVTSTLEIAWGLYDGTTAGPNLAQPLAMPLTVDSFQTVWLVSEPVPTSVLTGSYSAVVSATAVLTPGEALWASDLIWVGGWQAPPPALPPGARIYLPLVLRQ